MTSAQRRGENPKSSLLDYFNGGVYKMGWGIVGLELELRQSNYDCTREIHVYLHGRYGRVLFVCLFFLLSPLLFLFLYSFAFF